MTEERADDSGKRTPANDNPAPYGQNAETETASARKVDALVISIARLIGRQLAREHFEALRAANDNTPAGDDDGGSDEA